MPYIYSLIVIGVLYIPVHYWIKGKKRDQLKKEHEKEIDRLLSMDEHEMKIS